MDKKENPYKEIAILKFKKYFFHNERNLLAAGKQPDPGKSATEAMWKTRQETMELIKSDPDFQNNIDREEIWADALYWVMYFRQMLVDLKVIEPMVAPISHHEQIKDTTKSGEIVSAFANGVDLKAEAALGGIEHGEELPDGEHKQ